MVDNATDRVYQFDAAASRTSGSQSPSTSFAFASGNTNPQGIADPPVPTLTRRASEASLSAGTDAALMILLNEDLAVLGRRK
jgi:hypothetical protein